jgi:hypothetical protein
MKKDPTLVKMLNDAFEWSEGKHSGIPECCIHEFINGRTFEGFGKTLSEKNRVKLYKNWGYVPCDNCFKYNRFGKAKSNGTSIIGKMLLTLIAEANGQSVVYYGDRGVIR